MDYLAWRKRNGLAPVLCALGRESYRQLEAIGIGQQELFARLEQLGCKILSIDLEAVARRYLGRPYVRQARWQDAPDNFDCSTYLRWVYAQAGIWLPRYTWQLQEEGELVEAISELIPNDILLTSGDDPFYLTSIKDGIGHCGLYTAQGTVLHATNGDVKQVIETSFDEFSAGGLQAIRRLLDPTEPTFTVICPTDLEVDRTSQLVCEVLKRLS